jgi:TM2 domain-containing membrane protein YozV
VPVSSDLVKYCSVDIVRKGIGRTYRVEIVNGEVVKTFYWKGSKAALSLFDARDNEAKASDGNGNLKFFAADRPDDILAVWQNRTDRRILGSLGVIAELDVDSDGLLEGLIVSCLAVVVAERISGRGWFGGLGKSRGT